MNILKKLGILAAAAGVFFYGTKKGREYRDRLRPHAIKIAQDIKRLAAEKWEQLDEITYHELVDKAVAQYNRATHLDTTELKAIAADLKKQWVLVKKDIVKHGSAVKKKAARRMTKAARK
jgi:uncharacterized protein YciI